MNPPKIDFRTDGTYLVPYVNGVPGTGVDLKRIIVAAETNTRLQYDPQLKRLVYTNEDESVDSITVASLISALSIQDLKDVGSGFPTNGDMFTYDAIAQTWRPYTIPLGTIVSIVGVDEDGKLVKSESDAEPTPGGEGVAIPIGGGITWDGPLASIPTGFVPKDGRELSRTVYASLFNIIGTLHGAGNGTTTFNIPNTQGRTSVGKATSGTFANIGAAPGAEFVTLTEAQMPHHGHGVYDPGHGHGSGANYFMDAGGAGNLGLNTPGNRFAQGLSPLYINGSGTGIGIYGTGGSQAHNNVQPSLVEYHLIRII